MMSFLLVQQKFNKLATRQSLLSPKVHKTRSESTLNGWFKPLYEVLKSEIMKSDYLQGDETTVPVIDKEKQKTNK